MAMVTGWAPAPDSQSRHSGGGEFGGGFEGGSGWVGAASVGIAFSEWTGGEDAMRGRIASYGLLSQHNESNSRGFEKRISLVS